MDHEEAYLFTAHHRIVIVRTKSRETIAVEHDGATRYLKWITRKPWQQSTRADIRLLRVGRLVAIEVKPGERALRAHLVRIAVEGGLPYTTKRSQLP